MAKGALIILISAVVCIFFSLLSSAYAADRFFVEGKVYCDTCRVGFVTRVSQYMPSAKVKLECKAEEDGEVTYSSMGETDKDGLYSLPVDGDHEEEICAVTLVKSSMADCSEIDKGTFVARSARIGITGNNGMSTPVRQASSLGFLRKQPLPVCAQVLKELGITPKGLVD